MYMAAGAEYGDANNITDAGYAKLYARSGTDWNMIQQIYGTRPPSWANSGNFGYSLDLSHDGSMLAITENGGAVYMYEYSNITFLYELFHTINDISAREVSVSGDGMAVGVMTSSGAKIYEKIGDGFQQRGADVSDNSSSGIALNYDGFIVIVGDGVFQWKDNNEDGSMKWIQMGSDFTDVDSSEIFGYTGCVSITYDGLTVSVGAEGYGRDGLLLRGLVRVYNYDSISDTWQQSGIDLVGDNAGDRFSKTALSSDGTYLAVGAYYFGDYVKVFAKNGDNYETVGDVIISEIEGGFGRSVDMSADASALVVGDDLFTFDRSIGDSYIGKVYVYDTFSYSPSTAPTIAPIASSSMLPLSSPMSNKMSLFICMMLLWMF